MEGQVDLRNPFIGATTKGYSCNPFFYSNMYTTLIILSGKQLLLLPITSNFVHFTNYIKSLIVTHISLKKVACELLRGALGPGPRIKKPWRSFSRTILKWYSYVRQFYRIWTNKIVFEAFLCVSVLLRDRFINVPWSKASNFVSLCHIY